MTLRSLHGLDRRAVVAHLTRTAALLAALAPGAAHAQSAIIYGSLGNFDISNDTGKIHISGPNREEFDEDPAFDDQMGWIDQWIEAEYFYRMNIHNHGNHYHLF